MIAQTLDFIVNGLDQALRMRHPSEDSLAVLEPIANVTAGSSEGVVNKLVVSLVNLERESTASNASRRYRNVEGTAHEANPPLHLNLFILVAANFPDNYKDGLTLLSSAIGHFQSHPLMTPQAAPDMPVGLGRLSVEWHDVDMQETHNMWSTMGGKYLPSAVYKLRLVTFDGDDPSQPVPVVTSTSVSV